MNTVDLQLIIFHVALIILISDVQTSKLACLIPIAIADVIPYFIS